MKNGIPKVGDMVNLSYPWLPGDTQVLAVFPYNGKYKESFGCVIRYSAPTASGHIDSAFPRTNRNDKEKQL